MSAQKVDVWAAMDEAIRTAGAEGFKDGRELIACRAAVAELIGAANRVSAAMAGYPFYSDALKSLRDALDNIGSEK